MGFLEDFFKGLGVYIKNMYRDIDVDIGVYVIFP